MRSTMGSQRAYKSSASSPLRFYRIMPNDTSAKLVLPKELFNGSVGRLPETVHIRVPSGSVWQVQSQTRKTTFWLENGWKEFAEHHSLKYGHLLMFEYDGRGEFCVLIHDKSATEIQYPPRTNVKDEDSDFLQSEDEFDGEPKSETETDDEPPSPIVGNRAGKPTGSRSLRRRLINEEKKRAMKRTRDFKSRNPYFKIVMQRRYIVSKHDLAVPLQFARKYLGDKQLDISLCDSAGTSWWPVIYRAYFEEEMIKKKANLSRGWKKFSLDKKLQIGDVCVFERISKRPMILKVHIF